MKEYKIWSNGLLLGRLQIDSRGGIIFRYDTEWIVHRPRLHLSEILQVSPQRYEGEQVRNYFDNLLPDGEMTRQALAQKFNVSSRVEDLISEVGRDCIGSIQILSAQAPCPIVKEPTGEPCSESELAQMLRKCAASNAGSISEDFRISLAGAQKKTALLLWKNRWHIPTGTTPTTHIWKLPIGEWNFGNGRYDFNTSVVNEHYCLQVLKKVGFSVTDSEIGRFEDQTTLIVKRFDRFSQHGKIYRSFQEDFCQVLGLSSAMKYEKFNPEKKKQLSYAGKIIRFLKHSNKPSDPITFLKAQVMNLVLAGADGHAKNYSILRNSKGYALSPLYDVLSFHGVVKNHPKNKGRVKLAFRFGESHESVYETDPRQLISYAKDLRLDTKDLEEFIDNLPDLLPQALSEAQNELPALSSAEKAEISAIKTGALQMVRGWRKDHRM